MKNNRSAIRSRKQCSKCKQLLSYSAYTRHKNPLVCPGNTASASPSIEDIASNCVVTEPDLSCDNNNGDISGSVSDPESDHDLQGSCSDEDVVEIFDDSTMLMVEYTNVNSETIEDDSPMHSDNSSPQHSSPQHPTVDISKPIVQFVCFFATFLQLCYKLSDRALTLLLIFLRSVLTWVSLIVPSPANKLIQDVVENIPSNVYFLRKSLPNAAIQSYIVCPQCCYLYKKDCFSTLSTLDIPKCSNKVKRKTTCNALLFKKVKHGSHYKLVPVKLYAYYPIKNTLAKFYGRKEFHQNCETWRKRRVVTNLYTDIYDGAVWKQFLSFDGKPFLLEPYNLSLKLNVDWIQPFDHIQYSMGIIYLVVENLPKSERFKVENVILVGCIPGPREPKRDINPFLSPLVDELLELWKGVQLKTSSIFGYTSVRCAVTCITTDLPATRKMCGFAGHSAIMGCSKCKINFKSGIFGEKLDYSGYDRDSWEFRDHASHMTEITEISRAKTWTEQLQLEKKYGSRYSELLRLPYFDIVRYHCVDVMHNLLLGTAKRLLSLWVTNKSLTQRDLDAMQYKLDKMLTPAFVGRIPYKISSQGSSFTADQWKNWVTIFSLYALRDILPPQDYDCMVLFVQACTILLQPVITLDKVEEADELLLSFCKKYQNLYGAEKCTPNMHLHCHIKETILDYGPVHASWCFAFERYNGIFESFKKNWIYPEVQLASKFLKFQDIAVMDMPFHIPLELTDMLEAQSSRIRDIVCGQGSLLATHVDSFLLNSYLSNCKCPLNQIDACEKEYHHISAKRYEKMFSPIEVQWLTDVYKFLYPDQTGLHVLMIHEVFHEVDVLGEHYTCQRSKGSNRSSWISAAWADKAGRIKTTDVEDIHVGEVQYYFLHSISLTPETTIKRAKVNHIFAKVFWNKVHPRKSWLPNPLMIVDTEFDSYGPSVFIPLSRIQCRCAFTFDKIKFDYGEDHVAIASPLPRKLS